MHDARVLILVAAHSGCAASKRFLREIWPRVCDAYRDDRSLRLVAYLLACPTDSPPMALQLLHRWTPSLALYRAEDWAQRDALALAQHGAVLNGRIHIVMRASRADDALLCTVRAAQCDMYDPAQVIAWIERQRGGGTAPDASHVRPAARVAHQKIAWWTRFWHWCGA